MAVTIDEMHVEVHEPAAASAAASSGAGAGGQDAKKEMPLHDALRIMHERKLRLKAD